MPIVNQENSVRILADENYPILCVSEKDGETVVSTEKPNTTDFFQIPNLSAKNFGDSEFKKTYGLQYALYGGAMANGIASSDMVIALGKAGCMGSYGSGGRVLKSWKRKLIRSKAH